jgi:hypothetical protein
MMTDVLKRFRELVSLVLDVVARMEVEMAHGNPTGSPINFPGLVILTVAATIGVLLLFLWH